MLLKKPFTSFFASFSVGMLCMQLWLFRNSKVKGKAWTPLLDCVMFTVCRPAEPIFLSLFLCLSLCLSLAFCFTLSPSSMWCCGSWLHSIQCNPPPFMLWSSAQTAMKWFFFFLVWISIISLYIFLHWLVYIWEPSHWQKKKEILLSKNLFSCSFHLALWS